MAQDVELPVAILEVERDRALGAIEVGDLEVYMSNADTGINRPRR
jgi:hypothetical protein